MRIDTSLSSETSNHRLFPSRDMPKMKNGGWDFPIADELFDLHIEFFCVDLDHFEGEFIFEPSMPWSA